VGIDRTTGADAEADEQQPADRRPPPPDQPGLEPEGVPSRADSHAAAAAANKEAQANEESGEQAPAAAEARPDSSPVAQSPEADELEEQSNEPTAAQSDEMAAIEDTDEQPPLDATPDETSETQRTESPRPFDDPGNEPEGVPSRADSRAAAAAANAEQTTEDPQVGVQAGQPGQAEAAEATVEILRGSDDTRDSALSREDQASPAESFDVTASMDTAQETQASDNPPTVVDEPSIDEEPDAVEAETVEGSSVTDLGTTIDPADEIAEKAESTDNVAKTSGNGAEPDGQDSTSEDKGRADDDPATEFMVENKRVRVHGVLDPSRAQDWSNEFGDQPTDPTDRAGDRIAEEKNDKASRRDRARRDGYKKAEDALDVAKRNTDTVRSILQRPSPTGHPETTTARETPKAPHDGIGAGDAATGVLVAGMLIDETIRWAREKLAKMEEQRHGGD